MFGRLEISIWRAFFWPVANLFYWGLILLSWWDTRFKIFLAVGAAQKFAEARNFGAVMQNIGEIRSRAITAMAESGALQGDFIMIPLVMAVVLFIAPFVVRRDFRGPVTGAVVLPAMTLLCYFFASFLNLIVVAAMSAGIHYLLFKSPGPDMCMFMVHPLYLIYPIFQSVPGFLSQCVYLLYAATVLCTESIPERREDDERGGGDETRDDGDDWDKSACLMEMDRLTRIIGAKFDAPSFMDRLRSDAASYINRPGQAANDVRLGWPHYRIVLTEIKNSLRAILSEAPGAPKAAEVFAFVAGEMERMEYITREDADKLKASVGIVMPDAGDVAK
jgi:hypothetical protein